MKGKSCLIHLLAFHKEIFVSADERSGHVDPDFSKALDRVSQDWQSTDQVSGQWAVDSEVHWTWAELPALGDGYQQQTVHLEAGHQQCAPVCPSIGHGVQYYFNISINDQVEIYRWYKTGKHCW